MRKDSGLNLSSILDMIDEGNLIKQREISISTKFDRANLELLSIVHSAEYLSFVNTLSKKMERRGKEGSDDEILYKDSVVPFTPMVQRSMMKNEVKTNRNHSDTSSSAGSLKAARRAAGAVQHTADCVLMVRTPNAFCIVRPPGHHAGYDGLLNDSESSGF